MIIVILNLLEPLKMVIRKEEVNKLKRGCIVFKCNTTFFVKMKFN